VRYSVLLFLFYYRFFFFIGHREAPITFLGDAILPPESVGAECVIHKAVFAVHLVRRFLVMEIVCRRWWEEEEDVRDLVAAVLIQRHCRCVQVANKHDGHVRLQNQRALMNRS